jgi:hypothetical protein
MLEKMSCYNNYFWLLCLIFCKTNGEILEKYCFIMQKINHNMENPGPVIYAKF